MFNRVELIIGGICVGTMALALYFVQTQSTFVQFTAEGNPAAVVAADEPDIVIVGADDQAARAQAIVEAADSRGNLERMVIDDVKVGTGAEAQEGDTVQVHYVGTLQNGQEFDNSRKRGEPFQFTIGAGQVIAGWEQGVAGMKVGGQRVLVIPPELGYGAQGIGPIPGNATLVFAIELVEIN